MSTAGQAAAHRPPAIISSAMAFEFCDHNPKIASMMHDDESPTEASLTTAAAAAESSNSLRLEGELWQAVLEAEEEQERWEAECARWSTQVEH
jgi:hypothetical protein